MDSTPHVALMALAAPTILARALYSPRETEALLGISHATLYRLINAGKLDARKIGCKTAIPAASIERFLAGLPRSKCAA
jgi:excisionase family DNA binding protein